MTSLSDRDAISIAQITAFSPLFIVALFLLRRHGIGHGVGWVFIAVLSLLRVVGAALGLATISNPRSVSLYVGTATCNGIGLSPLLLAMAGVIDQLTLHLDDKLAPHFLGLSVKLHSLMIEIVAILALILAIVGSVHAGDEFGETGRYVPQSLSKAGTALFILVFVAVLDLVIFATHYANRGMLYTRRPALLKAAWVSLPLVLVRLVYACLGNFYTASDKFNILTGNVWIWLGMAVVEEILVVVVFEAAGIVTPPARDQ